MKTSPKRSYSVIENERFGLVFAKTGSIISGTDEVGITIGRIFILTVLLDKKSTLFRMYKIIKEYREKKILKTTLSDNFGRAQEPIPVPIFNAHFLIYFPPYVYEYVIVV